MLGSFSEGVRVAFTVISSIVFEWWIVLLFLFAAEMVLGAWVFWLIGIQREFAAVFGIFWSAVFAGIPLRERFIVERNSVFQRSADWIRERVS